jgi:hypothetical protein
MSYADDIPLCMLENKDVFEKWLENPVQSKLPPLLLESK